MTQIQIDHAVAEATGESVRTVHRLEDDHSPGCEADHPSRNLVFRGERVEPLGQSRSLAPEMFDDAATTDPLHRRK